MNNSFNNSFENKEPQLMLRDNDEPDIEEEKSQHSNHDDSRQENEIPEIISSDVMEPNEEVNSTILQDVPVIENVIEEVRNIINGSAK